MRCNGDTPPLDTCIAAQPRAFSAWPKAMVLSRSQPPSTQSVADTRTHTGTWAGTAAAHGFEDLEREAHPLVQAAAVGVAALVADRRQELMQQVAMRAVQLDAVEAGAHRTHRRVDEGTAHAHQAGVVQRQGSHFARRVRQRRRRHGQPAAGLVRAHLLAAVPGRVARRLAARVAELDRQLDRRLHAHGAHHLGQRRFLRVVVQSDAAAGDPAVAFDRGGLDDQQPGTRDRQLSQVHAVPVTDHTVDGRVLAHGGDDDAVGQGQRAELPGVEESGHERCLRVGLQ
jgi:hypothetical protein